MIAIIAEQTSLGKDSRGQRRRIYTLVVRISLSSCKDRMTEIDLYLNIYNGVSIIPLYVRNVHARQRHLVWKHSLSIPSQPTRLRCCNYFCILCVVPSQMRVIILIIGYLVDGDYRIANEWKLRFTS